MIDAELDLRAGLERPRGDLATMHDQAVDRLLRVFDFEARTVDLDDALVTHLAPLLRIEWRGARDDLARRARPELVDRATVRDQREDLALRVSVLVPEELDGSEALERALDRRRPPHCCRPSSPGCARAPAELVVEALLVDLEALLFADHVSGDRGGSRRCRRAERRPFPAANVRRSLDPLVVVGDELKPAVERAAEALFLLLGDLLDERAALAQLRVDIAHVVDDAKGTVREERLADAEPVPVANRAAHHPAKHVRAPVLVGEYALGDQERRGAGVVGDDPHADVVVGLAPAVAFARNLGGQVDDRSQEVGVVVAQDTLFDDGDPLEAGAGVDRRGGQRIHTAIGVALELHEDQVPELEPAAAVGGWLFAKGSRVDVVEAEAVVNLGARPAGAGVAHLPEVVFGAAADDALVGKPVTSFQIAAASSSAGASPSSPPKTVTTRRSGSSSSVSMK